MAEAVKQVCGEADLAPRADLLPGSPSSDGVIENQDGHSAEDRYEKTVASSSKHVEQPAAGESADNT